MQSITLPPLIRWLMRILAIAGLGVSGFLLFTHIAAHYAAASATVPFCSGLSWVDCKSVLNSRYAQVLGVPTAFPATITYLILTIVLFVLTPRSSERTLRISFWLMIALTTSAAGAAIWFTYLQLVVVGQVCSYCMAVHVIGVVLAGLVWLHVFTRRSMRRAGFPALVGLVGVGLLIALQLMVPVKFTKTIEWQATDERWAEPAPPEDQIVFADGHITLDRRARPTLGLSAARRYVIEVIDYTCPRCAILHELLRDARDMLPPDIAVVLVFAPQHSSCNDEILEDIPAYEHACSLTRLALAVWLADSTKFEPFHNWLFEHAEELSPEIAQQEAGRLVGENALNHALADPRVEQIIQRDLALAQRIGIGQLPGLIVADRSFSALPEQPRELARQIHRAFKMAESAPPPH